MVQDARGTSNLDALLSPKSIAIVGASDDSARIGGMPLQFLLSSGYTGRIYPVNAHRDQVQGVRAYRRIADIPNKVDLAIIAVAAEHVVGIVEECAASGVRGVIIYSAGFAEI